MKWKTYKNLSVNEKIEWEFRFKNKDDDLAHGFTFSLVVTILLTLVVTLFSNAVSGIYVATLLILLFTLSFVIGAFVLKLDEMKWIRKKLKGE